MIHLLALVVLAFGFAPACPAPQQSSAHATVTGKALPATAVVTVRVAAVTGSQIAKSVGQVRCLIWFKW